MFNFRPVVTLYPPPPLILKTDRRRWVQVTISLIYYRFIVRFTIGLEFLFITLLLQFFVAQMSSLSMSWSAIYSSTFSNHIHLSVYILSVYLKVVMHQGSVLSPLLFGVVMDVVSSEERSGIPFELLYADDLVLMTMAGRNDGNITVNSGK